MPITGTINRWIAPVNANSLNCRAVSLNADGDHEKIGMEFEHLLDK
jgi:hypothetical protein